MNLTVDFVSSQIGTKGGIKNNATMTIFRLICHENFIKNAM